MNRFIGHITSVETEGGLSLITVEIAHGLSVNCIVIDTPDTAPYLEPDRAVNVLFKETEVVVGLDNATGISMRNKIPCTVIGVKEGKLLTSLELECAAGRLHSIISTFAVSELEISSGISVTAMIKLNEIMLSPE
jgi:molybdopterin-binding protein